MRLYAQNPVRRALQVTGDLLLLVWIWAWLEIAGVVHDSVAALAEPGEQLQGAASGLAGQLRGAGDAVAGVPLVGEEIRSPFDGAGDAADRIAAAGQAQADAVASLAFWLTLAVALIPVLLALAVHLPRRLRFARRASAGARLVDSAADVDLFALRALTHQPLHRIARISDDPLRAFESRDPEVLRRLAALELADAGLAPRSARALPTRA